MNKTNLTPKQRIQELGFYLDLSSRALAQIVGINENTLYHITDESLGISPRTATKICFHLEKKKGVHINKNWLLTGEGEMINEKPVVTQKKDEDNTPTSIEKKNGEDIEDYCEKYYRLLEEYNNLMKRYLKLIEK